MFNITRVDNKAIQRIEERNAQEVAAHIGRMELIAAKTEITMTEYSRLVAEAMHITATTLSTTDLMARVAKQTGVSTEQAQRVEQQTQSYLERMDQLIKQAGEDTQAATKDGTG